MYIYIFLIFILKISINIAFPSSESFFNNSNSYGLDLKYEYITGGFDFNGDGKQDFITTHLQTDKTYVFFGDISRYSDQRPLKLSMIDGINGFSIDISKIDLLNYFICGDINNDGYDEIITRLSNKQLKIIYGHAGPFKNDFSNFDGIDGFVIDTDLSPAKVTYQVLCDHNGDGIKDLIFNTLDDVYVLYGLDNGKKFPTNSGKFDIKFVSNGTNGHIIQKKFSKNLGCGDLNNDGIDDLVILSDTGNGTVTFGLKFYPTQYNPVLNGTTGFTMDIQGNDFVLQSGFGDFNGDGLKDMAVVSQDFKSIYMIYGKKGGIWESHFDINSGNSSEVVKWVEDVSSPEELCLYMHVGDFNGDGISDISCNVNPLRYTWGVYGTTIKLPAVYKLNFKTLDDCSGFSISRTETYSAWTDFNNDGIQDLILYFRNSMNYILFGEKASLNIINTSIAYNSSGEYRFLESNFNPNSIACYVQFITFKVLGNIDPSDQLSFSSSNTTSSAVSISNGELQVFNKNRDPNFLQSLSNVLFKTNRNSSIATISITYLNIINDTIKIFTSNPTITTSTATTSTVTGTSTTSTSTTSTSATSTTSTSATTGTTATTSPASPITSTATTTGTLNNTVNNDCICIIGQICLQDSHICVNEIDVYQGGSCLQNSCALGYDCKEKSNQIYKCVKQDSCLTCADITCKSPHLCILVLTTSQKCKYQPTCSN
ncbi:tenascin X [Tieghemostelium lacteum]|uniref:Tenascin X n=1 Tax=Tieghemostelium lacteum TaxID=361077 RepID=A0A152A1L7_TIELA|nr:tenascin X [Tieghemostelium lacteum]|eukprot:KYR00142.1 tenascin X [Tieghemostelium lacteum]